VISGLDMIINVMTIIIITRGHYNYFMKNFIIKQV